MVRVCASCRQDVAEHRCRFFERDAMFGKVLRRLAWIPFEAQLRLPHLIRRLTTIRPLDRLICVIPQPLRTPAAYTDLEPTPSTGSPAFRSSHLRPRGATFAGRDRLRRRAAYPDAYTLQGRRRGHGPNIRSAGLLTAAGPRFRTWV